MSFLKGRVLAKPSAVLGRLFHSSRCVLGRQHTYKKLKPRYPPKQIDGVPVYHLIREQAVKDREKMREYFEQIKDIPVEHYKLPEKQAYVRDFETGTATEIIKLNEKVWGQEIRRDIVHRVVVYHRARMRQGTHKQKNRSEVRGGGRKPRPQKGSGQARMGSLRTPLRPGGGRVHARRPRDYSIKIPKKVLSKSLQICLTAKFLEGNMFVINSPEMSTHKTKALVTTLRRRWKLYDNDRKLWRRVAIITGKNELDPNLALAARTMQSVDFFPYYAANTWDVVRREVVILTKAGLRDLEARLLQPDEDGRVKFLEDAPLKPAQSLFGLPDVVPVLTEYDVKRVQPKKPKVDDIARPWLYGPKTKLGKRRAAEAAEAEAKAKAEAEAKTEAQSA